MTNLHYAIRQLCKAPSFTVLAVLTLAVGIGMNTAIFSLVDKLFLRGLPFPEPNRILRIYGEAKNRNLQQLPFSVPRFWHYRDNQTVFSALGADYATRFILADLGDPIQLNGLRVTSNYFEVLGVRPILGRLFLQQEEQAADVAIISENCWRNRFGSDPHVVGRSITLNGVTHTVVGVLPNMPVAWFGQNLEVCTTKPFELASLSRDQVMRGVSFLRVVGRLKPGVTMEQAKAALPALQDSYHIQNPDKADATWTPVVLTVPADVTENLRDAFVTLLLAVGFVLFIACINVANLMLVRFIARRREIALRMALGASRFSIVCLFIVESTLVSLLAGFVGLGLAVGMLRLIPRIVPNNLALEPGIATNVPILVFAIALALLTGLAVGVYPAWQSSRADLVEGLKEGGRSIGGSSGQQRLRRILLAAQVGLSVVLLAAAGLLIASFIRLSSQESGFQSAHLWVGGIALPPAQYADNNARGRFAERLLSDLRVLPGIDAVGITNTAPLTGRHSQSPYARAEGDVPPLNLRPLGPSHSISPGYLLALRIPLLAGRDFEERDDLDHPPVVIISRSTAKRLFPGEDPIGRSVFLGSNNGIGERVEIVGVVGDVRSIRLSRIEDAEFYRPWSQRPNPFMLVIARSAASPGTTMSVARSAVARIDAGLPVIQPTTMDEIVSESLNQQRLTTALIATFAGIALLLATLGIYGAVTNTVAQRSAEIGVRIALGAQTRDVLRLVVMAGMKPVFMGLLIGMAVALTLARLLTGQLYQVSAYNPVFLLGATVILASAALIACMLPAWRGSRVNPLESLRNE